MLDPFNQRRASVSREVRLAYFELHKPFLETILKHIVQSGVQPLFLQKWGNKA